MLSVTIGNDLLTALAGRARFVSLHSADPMGSGLAEISKQRMPITWEQPEDGALQIAGEIVLNVPAGPVNHFGLWTDQTAGTWCGGGELSEVVFTVPGTYVLLGVEISLLPEAA